MRRSRVRVCSVSVLRVLLISSLVALSGSAMAQEGVDVVDSPTVVGELGEDVGDVEAIDDADETDADEPEIIDPIQELEAIEEEEDDVTVIEIEDVEDAQTAEDIADAVDAVVDPVSKAILIREVTVLGTEPDEIEAIPGSIAVVSQKDLQIRKPMSANEALRDVPGLHVQAEEGAGLRQNIGIRGLSPTRGRQILIMEDGAPIAIGPYGEPEMYFVPPIERIERIEIIKGSGSILYGPQTIGGVINYVTPRPSEEFELKLEARGGNLGYGLGQVSVSDTLGQVGYLFSAMHSQFTGHRNVDAKQTDVTGKVEMRLTATQSLTLKLNVYDELSKSTYLGLTTPQYEHDPSAEYAKHDVFDLRRYAGQLTHSALFGGRFLLETRAYGHIINRYWQRQNFDRSYKAGVDYERVIDGNGRDIKSSNPLLYPTDGSAIFFRNETGNRNREFTIGGVEPRLTVEYDLGPVENELQTGVRIHNEQTRERYIVGDHANSPSGVIRDDDHRSVTALSAYVLNQFMFLDRKLRVSPGVRVENVWNERTTYRKQVNGTPTDLDPAANNSSYLFALIPSAGVSYQVAKPVTVFGGVHRGFAPPRIKDAITTDGVALELDAEHSWNYELGARAVHSNWLRAELTGFMLNFSNQIIPPAEADGAVVDLTGGAAVVNGGETVHMGFESGLIVDPAAAAGLGFNLPIFVNYTYVHAEFGEGWNETLKGNRLPYAPEHQISGGIRFEHESGLTLATTANWISEQFTDKNETVEASIDGTVGRIDARLLLDAQVSYTYAPFGMQFYVAGKNLLDERFIASRAPQGIKPGVFRQVFAGVQKTF